MPDQKIILTIDDEKFIRHSFRAFLEDLDYQVLEAENGRRGIEVCRNTTPDLVLLDLKMPEMSGLEVLQALINEFPDLPVIVVSGVGIVDDVLKAIRRGAWDYILKPIQDFAMLKYCIDKSLEKAALLKENKIYKEQLEEMVLVRTRALENTNQKLSSEIEYRMHVESNLFDSQKMLTSILETVPDIIYRLDKDGNINFISSAVQKYGYKPFDFLDRSILEFVHPEDYNKSYWHLKTRRTGSRKTKNFEVRLFNNLDSERYPIFMLESEGIYNNESFSDFIGTQGVVRDISLRKEAEDKVKKSLLEKESLLREVHHRVKNNMQVILSLLSLQMKDVKNEEIQNILKESQNRIMSMAIVHESIYKTDNFAEINMETFIRNLYLQIHQSYNIKKEIDMTFLMEKIFVSLDSSVPLSIILNELFTNIFKHAFVTNDDAKIILQMKKIDDSKCLVSVEDNGVGIPENINPDKPTTMGLSLIKTLTRQLNGELKVERLKQGTRTTIIFDPTIIQSSF